MSLAQALLPEFDQEMAATRRLLALIPDAKADYRPHPKSQSLGALGVHLASLPTWVERTLRATEFDLATVMSLTPPQYTSVAATCQTFDTNVAAARAALAAASDRDLLVSWTLKKAGQTLFTFPRQAILRSFVLSHMIHHRGQLTVYLRLCDIGLPPTYGPTADAPF